MRATERWAEARNDQRTAAVVAAVRARALHRWTKSGGLCAPLHYGSLTGAGERCEMRGAVARQRATRHGAACERHSRAFGPVDTVGVRALLFTCDSGEGGEHEQWALVHGFDIVRLHQRTASPLLRLSPRLTAVPLSELLQRVQVQRVDPVTGVMWLPHEVPVDAAGEPVFVLCWWTAHGEAPYSHAHRDMMLQSMWQGQWEKLIDG